MAKVDYLIKFDDDGNRGETHDAVFMTDAEIADYQAKDLLRSAQQIIITCLATTLIISRISAKPTERLSPNLFMCRRRQKRRLRSCPNWTTNTRLS